jgi:hypothetical protein
MVVEVDAIVTSWRGRGGGRHGARGGGSRHHAARGGGGCEGESRRRHHAASGGGGCGGGSRRRRRATRGGGGCRARGSRRRCRRGDGDRHRREEEEVCLHGVEKKRGGPSGKNERRTVNPREDVSR